MTTFAFTDLSLRTRSRSRGALRSSFDRVVEARDPRSRRFLPGPVSLADNDQLALAGVERDSLFDPACMQRR